MPSLSFPNSLDAALVMPLATRFLLQSLPSLAGLLDLLTRRETAPLDSTVLDLLLQLIDRMFVSGVTPPQMERPQTTGLITAMPAVQSNAAAAHSATLKSVLAEYTAGWSGPVRPTAPATLLSASVTPNYMLLDSVRSMLESLEVHWCTLLQLAQPISRSMLTTFSAQPPAKRRMMLIECIAALRGFLRQPSLASLSQSQSQSPRGVLTHALCQRLWEQWKQREADLQSWEHKSAEATKLGARATEFLASTATLVLLPDSYLWRSVQLLDTVANATLPNVAAPAADSPSPFFPMLILLLDALIPHLSRYSGLYEQRRADTEATLDESFAGIPLLARPIAFLFHEIRLYPSLLAQLSPLSRLHCFERSPATFEAELIASVSRVSSQLHPLRPHLLTHLVDQEMRSLFGMSIEPGATSANPSSSAPSSSPSSAEFSSSISLLFRRTPIPSSIIPLSSPAPMPSPPLLPPPVRRIHLASEHLYAVAAGIVEGLLVRTNSEGENHVMHSTVARA